VPQCGALFPDESAAMLRLLAVLTLLAIAGPCRAAAPIVHMVLQGGATYEGRIVAANKQTCWIAEPNGRFQKFGLSEVTEFKNVSGAFTPTSPSAMRDELKQELGPLYEVELRGPCVVAAPRGHARSYATLLDSTAKAFSGYVGRRQLPAQKIEFPLVVVILADAKQFKDQCQADRVEFHPTLRGYYHPITNRVALYEGEPPNPQVSQRPTLQLLPQDSGLGTQDSFLFTQASPSHPFHVKRNPRPTQVPTGEPPWANLGAATTGDLKSTLVHEAIHQLAFNTGLHSRVGDVPRWVPEGLAMLLEGEAQLRDVRGNNACDRVNLERYVTFQQIKGRRSKDPLAQLVSADEAFRVNPLGSYAETWALTFFLTETRSSRYADYLNRLARRDHLSAYSSADRLKDFRDAFGSDVRLLDSQLVDFIDGLKVRTR
jgi:hypothetical protein